MISTFVATKFELIRRFAREVRGSGAGRAAAGVFAWLAARGTHGYAEEEQRRLKILNMIAALIALTTGVYALQQTSLDYTTYRPIILINTALFAMAVLLPFLHRFGPIVGAIVLVVCEYAAMIALSAYMGRNTGLHMQLFVPAAAAFVVLGFERLRLVLLVTVAGLAVHLYIWFAFPPERALLQIDPGMLTGLYVQAAVTTCGLIAATVWYAFSLVEKARGETDALLRNILPQSVVDRIKSRPGQAIADQFEEASVLFADISGFVPLSRSLGPERVVAMLNQLVSEFDVIAAKHGVEKIKTIGDAYMAACGVPVARKEHVRCLVLFAFGMLEAVERLRRDTGLDVRMRVGMAAGPVMAGVIGCNKFSYDVWGDTVNLAARLEGMSMPGRILVCTTCRAALEDEFAFEGEGKVELKGIGEMEAWFVVGKGRQ